MSEIRSQATPARDGGREGLAGSISGFGKSFLGEFEEVDMQALTGPFDKMADYLADHLIDDLGWSKPRTVNGTAELDALPVGSVIRSEDVTALKARNGAWLWDDGNYWEPLAGREVRVLFTPGDAG